MGEIAKRVQESRLKWYGPVLRREDEYVGKRVMQCFMQRAVMPSSGWVIAF